MDAASRTTTPDTDPARPRQLPLLTVDDTPDWRLDEPTRAVGRRGIEQARAALRAARRRQATLEGAEAGQRGDRATAA